MFWSYLQYFVEGTSITQQIKYTHIIFCWKKYVLDIHSCVILKLFLSVWRRMSYPHPLSFSMYMDVIPSVIKNKAASTSEMFVLTCKPFWWQNV